MLALSLVQGLVLLLLWRAMTNETWPSQTPLVNFPLWTFSIAWPLLLLLSLEVGNTLRVVRLAGAFSAILVLLAVYIGWQATPFGEFPVGSMLAIFIATLTVACFKALMYMQQRAAGLPLTYEVLFAFSWRNFQVAMLAYTFVAIVAGLLALWAELFLVIGIEFFKELFSKDWFLFPVLAVAFGIGVFIFRSLTGMIDNITGLLAGLMRLLLPLVILIMVIFLAALPFTGLDPLWETGSGTSLLLWLNAAALFFINAVYQSGRQTPYPALVQRLLCPGIALLPVVSALALYGLYLRIEQYGWSVARCWGLSVAILLGLFSCGYLWGIIRRRWDWTGELARVNIVMGWVVLALMLLVNTPVLDFRSISLASQLARLERGEIELGEFDFSYLRYHLARPGFLETQTLLEQLRSTDPELARSISMRIGLFKPDEKETPLWEQIVFRPQGFEVPADLRELIEQGWSYHSAETSGQDDEAAPDEAVEDDAGKIDKRERVYAILRNLDWRSRPVMIRVDLNNDGAFEYALIGSDRHGYTDGVCFYLHGAVWHFKTLHNLSPPDSGGKPEGDVTDLLHQGEIRMPATPFHDLQVGELRFWVSRY